MLSTMQDEPLPLDGAAAPPEELREFLAGKVARWQLSEWRAFTGELPRISVGKFDKKALRARYADVALLH